MRRQEAIILVLPQTRQQCFQGRLDVSDGAERDCMTVSDMRGIEVDLNDLRPVGIELGALTAIPLPDNNGELIRRSGFHL